MEIFEMSEETFEALDDVNIFDDDEFEYEGDSKPEKRVTLRDIIEAARANGIPHVRGSWFEVGKLSDHVYQVTGGCAVAQAARNLGVDPTYFQSDAIIATMVAFNDDSKSEMTLDQIADKMLADFPDDLDDEFVTHEADYSNGVPEYLFERLVSA